MVLRSAASRASATASGVGGASRAEPAADGRADSIRVFGTCARRRTRDLLIDETGLICRTCVEAIRRS